MWSGESFSSESFTHKVRTIKTRLSGETFWVKRLGETFWVTLWVELLCGQGHRFGILWNRGRGHVESRFHLKVSPTRFTQ